MTDSEQRYEELVDAVRWLRKRLYQLGDLETALEQRITKEGMDFERPSDEERLMPMSTLRMPFGIHKGKKPKEIPNEYRRWLLGEMKKGILSKGKFFRPGQESLVVELLKVDYEPWTEEDDEELSLMLTIYERGHPKVGGEIRAWVGENHGREMLARWLGVDFLEKQRKKSLKNVDKLTKPVARKIREDQALRIYLAGKIQKNCWRHTIVDGLRCADGLEQSSGTCPVGCELVMPQKWVELKKSVFGIHHYVGPFFQSCNHGCYHVDSSHGLLVEHKGVVSLCRRAIADATLVFAWIDSPDCFGTIAELGFAAALGKRIWIAGRERFPDLWFVYELAEKTRFEDQCPSDILGAMLNRLVPA